VIRGKKKKFCKNQEGLTCKVRTIPVCPYDNRKEAKACQYWTKPRIQVSSAKSKGRNLQHYAERKISEITGIPCGKDELVQSREMGQSGTDVKLVGIAKKMFPFSVECKCQESWSVPAWIEQAKKNQLPDTDWLLFMKRSRGKEVVVMDADAFFNLYAKYLDFVSKKNR